MARGKTFPYFPSQKEIRLGRWSLNANHDLELSLRSGKTEPFKETLTFDGKILGVTGNELLFATRIEREPGRQEIRLIRLKGFWRADSKNRLIFHVQKGKGKTNPLTFEGIWEVGPRHQILYRYRKENLLTGHSTSRHFILNGFWEIRKKNRLTYRLNLSGKSRFDFRTTLQSPYLVGKEGEIRYQIGIGLSGRRRQVREVTLFGKWKLSRELSLSFEMEYGKGERRAFLFGTAYRVTPQNEIAFTLRSRSGERLGAEVIFSRSFFKRQGKAFLRFYKDALESRIEGGVRIPF